MLLQQQHQQQPLAATVPSKNLGAVKADIPPEMRCFLCKGLFDEPLLLSCGHSFCRRCVQPWLRQSTNCPFCRCNTLLPIQNTQLAEKVADFKANNGKSPKGVGGIGGGNFIRSFVRRSVCPSKEARAFQREAVRASQRRPKNVVLPTSTDVGGCSSPNVRQMASSLEGKLRLLNNGSTANNVPRRASCGGDGTKQTTAFPRMGNLRRSFARIRNKVAGNKIVEETSQQLKQPEIPLEKRPVAVVRAQHPTMMNNNSSHHQNLPMPIATIGQLMARRNISQTSMRTQISGASVMPPLYSAGPPITLGTPRRPSMGISGSIFRQTSASTTPTDEEKHSHPSPPKGSANRNTSGGGGGTGCSLM